MIATVSPDPSTWKDVDTELAGMEAAVSFHGANPTPTLVTTPTPRKRCCLKATWYGNTFGTLLEPG